MTEQTYKTGDITKEEYTVRMEVSPHLAIKITLYTSLPSEADPGNEWQGVLEVNTYIVDRWYGSDVTEVATTGLHIVETMHKASAEALGV